MLTRRKGNSFLTDEAIQAIFEKRALLTGGGAMPKGEIISSNMPHFYAFPKSSWSDSATQSNRFYEEESARLTMFASEVVLRRDWDSPEEDEAWAHL